MVKVLRKNRSKTQILEGTKAYGQMRQELNALGVFNRDYIYYTLLFVFVFGGFFASAYFLYAINSVPLLIMVALAFSFFTVQMAGILHDAGHRTIFKSNKMNDVVGYICGFFLAMGYSSWKVKHNKHHAHPNQEDEDPDVAIPLFSFTHDKYSKLKGWEGFVKRYQKYLYYPLGSFVGFSVRAGALRHFVTNFNRKSVVEAVLLVVALFTWFALPFLIFDIGKALLILAVVSFAHGFYLLNVFAPNHKGMPQLAKNVKISFMEQQIMTSRNINGNPFTDFVYMGLNYQIEHHLFPNTPRNKLSKITPYVKAFCERRKVEFTETSIIQSNKIILAELGEVARTA